MNIAITAILLIHCGRSSLGIYNKMHSLYGEHLSYIPVCIFIRVSVLIHWMPLVVSKCHLLTCDSWYMVTSMNILYDNNISRQTSFKMWFYYTQKNTMYQPTFKNSMVLAAFFYISLHSDWDVTIQKNVIHNILKLNTVSHV